MDINKSLTEYSDSNSEEETNEKTVNEDLRYTHV